MDTISQMITLTVITISSFHCWMKYHINNALSCFTTIILHIESGTGLLIKKIRWKYSLVGYELWANYEQVYTLSNCFSLKLQIKRFRTGWTNNVFMKAQFLRGYTFGGKAFIFNCVIIIFLYLSQLTL